VDELVGLRLRGGERVADLTADGLRLEACSTESVPYGHARPRLERLRLSRLRVRGSALRGAILTDVVVDGVEHDLESGFVNACELSRVTVRGAVGTLVVQMRAGHGDPWLEHLQEVDRAAGPDDWALDISEAVGAVTVRGYAARRVRRDPARQAVMTLEQALAGRWRQVDLRGTVFDVLVEELLDHGWGDVILNANPADGRRYGAQLRAIEALRAVGAAEPA
jgi:hypothetical protein